MRFESVLRRGFQVPPRLLLSKVRERLHNALEAPLRRRQDWRRDTYGGVPEGIRIEYLLPPNTLGDLSELHPGLQHFAEQALAGRMNLLGSGWRSTAFKGPEQRQVPPNTRATSERIEGLKNDRCTRIDWHKDLRSGHRYNPLCWYRDVPIGRPVGAEIKTPWELARCHHLPQFACMARFAEEPATWVRAIEDHLLDFWAANPPRWGGQLGGARWTPGFESPTNFWPSTFCTRQVGECATRSKRRPRARLGFTVSSSPATSNGVRRIEATTTSPTFSGWLRAELILGGPRDPAGLAAL
ncbi:MAG: hypothetical protein UZ18_ATM001002276, partial [Armatimonadetes bacterium OLB18]